MNTYQMENDCQADIQVLICRRKELPSDDISREFSGNYKGIPWAVVIKDKNDHAKERLFFYSRFFAGILAKRIVYVPHLKDKCIANDSVLLPCSVFSYQKNNFLLFGKSGSGKTKLLLKALDKGATYVGDERLILYPSGDLVDSSSVIALGYATVRETSFWDKLSIENRILLKIYHLIFLLSGKHIKFNIYLNPEQIDIERDQIFRERRVIFVNLAKSSKAYRMSLSETASVILEKEGRKRQRYGDIFSLLDKREKINEIITAFFANSSCWRVPTGTSLDEILDLE